MIAQICQVWASTLPPLISHVSLDGHWWWRISRQEWLQWWRGPQGLTTGTKDWNANDSVELEPPSRLQTALNLFEVNLKFHSWSIHPTQTYCHFGGENHIRPKLHKLSVVQQAQHKFCKGVWVKSILLTNLILLFNGKFCQSLILKNEEYKYSGVLKVFFKVKEQWIGMH